MVGKRWGMLKDVKEHDMGLLRDVKEWKDMANLSFFPLSLVCR
jgi:hypothetical protein